MLDNLYNILTIIFLIMCCTVLAVWLGYIFDVLLISILRK